MMRFMSCPEIVIKTRHEIHVQGPRSLKNREAPKSRINGLPKMRYNQKKSKPAYYRSYQEPPKKSPYRSIPTNDLSSPKTLSL
jgi:hypothetical protein